MRRRAEPRPLLPGARVQGVQAAVGGGCVHDFVAHRRRGTQLAQRFVLPDALPGGGVDRVSNAVQRAGVHDAVSHHNGAGGGVAHRILPPDPVRGRIPRYQPPVGH